MGAFGNDQAQVETYEAVMGAFYRLPFSEFLGEKDMDEGRTGWFHIGEKPKDMRVAILLSDAHPWVVVRTEWRNYFSDGRKPLKGEHTGVVSTYGDQQALELASQAAVVKVLELYKDVLAEDGVAGRLSDLVEEESSETGE